METKQMMEEMFNLQNKLNIETNGENWRKGVTKDGREINWKRCIYMEACEAIDSLNWKHWKNINKQDDIENLKIELVDIWHFIMSDIMSGASPVTNMFGIPGAVKLATFVYEQKPIKTDKTLIELIEEVARVAINGQTPTEEFFLLLDKIPNFGFNDVYQLYIGKNCLNKFRQNHEYKNGKYIKIWDGKEDNVYMQNILEDQKNITFNELYEQLEKRYKSLQK